MRAWLWALGGAGLIAVVAVAVALLGWWPSGETLSREELLRRGDDICARAHEAFAELQRDSPRTASEAAELTERLISIAEDELDEIRGLDAPTGLEERLNRYLDLREEGIELLREGLEAADAGDANRYEAAQAQLASTQRNPRMRAARRVGFEQCSRPLSARGERPR